MSSPLPPLPGETPEQRRARLNAAYAVQARINAQMQADLDAQEEARRKEMQARIDNMLRSAYVLPPLPQLPMPEMAAPKMAAPVLPQLPAPMIGDGPLRPTAAQLAEYNASGRKGIWDSVKGVFTTSPYGPPLPPEPPLPPPPPIPTYYDPVPPVMPPTMAPPPLQNLGEVLQRIQQKQPQVMPPVDPGFVIGPREPTGPIPTYYDPVPPVVQPTLPPVDIVENIRLPTPPTMMEPPMPTPAPMVIEPPVRVVQPKTTSYVPGYSPQPPAKPGELGYLQPPTQVDPGFVMDIPMFRPPMPTPEPYTPPVFEPYTPPMAEPYTPPSMQFSVDMPRMNYARDLYGVNPDNVSMLKRGGLAVKPKKGKC